MRRPVLIALLGALAATFWLQQTEVGADDADVVEVVERRAQPAGPTHQNAGPGAQPGRSAVAATPRQAGADARAAQDWLRDRVQAVRARRAEADALPPPRPMTSAAPSAWAAAVPPPPAPPKAAADAKPVAPPFPHQWVGRFDDEAVGGQKALRRAVISGPVSTWVAREGDVIEGQWRIDQIQERLMRLTYLPLQQSQTVALK
jgi:hypothetical protein